MMRFLAVAFLLPVAAQAGELRFVGVWDCGGATVVFTDSSYDPGTGPVAISAIEGDGHDFAISLSGGGTVAVSVSDDEQTMQVGGKACSRR